MSLEKALELSDEIILAVIAYDLERVSELWGLRQEQIEHYYQENSDADATQTLTLKKKNDEIVDLLGQLHEQTRVDKNTLQKSRQVSDAYLKNS